MKKFYAFAAAAAIAMSANAQALYMTGASTADADNGGLPAQWAPTNPASFEIVDGNYKLTVNGLTEFKVSTAIGVATEDDVDGWGAFNAAAYTCVYGEEPGVAQPLEPGDNNIVCPWEGEWTVEVAGDLSTITLTTNTPKPDLSVIELYLRGDMNAWDNYEGWMFEQLNDNTFKFVCGEGQQIGQGDTFKVATSNWSKYNYGAGEEDFLLDYDNIIFNGSNTNLSMPEAFNGVAWFCLNGSDEDPNAALLLLSNDKDYVPEWYDASGVANVAIDENAEVEYYTLQGVRVANPTKGIYVVVKGQNATKAVVK